MPEELFPEGYEVRVPSVNRRVGADKGAEAESVPAEFLDGGMERALDELGVYERDWDCVSGSLLWSA